MARAPGRRLIEKLRGARARHAARHRPSGFEFALADGIGYLDGEHWDALTASDSVFVSRAYLSALDAALPENVRTRYAIAYRSGKPAVAVAMQFAAVRGEDLAARTNGRELGKRVRLAAAARRRVRATLLLCGNLTAWGPHGARFARGLTPQEGWPAVAEALYRARRAERLARQTDLVLVKDLPDAAVHGIEALETYSYRPFETDPDMVLELPPSCASMDGYLAFLRSKYRSAARSVLEKTSKAGYRTALVEDVPKVAGRLHQLYLETLAGAQVRLFTLHPDYFPRLASALGSDFRCTALLRGTEIVGFVSVIRDGSTAVGYYMGFDRAANEEVPLYFRLLHAVIETSLAMGCRRISFGRTALDPKSRLGAKPVRMRCWIRHRVPVVNVALRRWLREIPHQEAPEHAAMKEAAGS
jgi:predicted N-acyltransferase